MKTLMLHEMTASTAVPAGLATFDDGLYSQYQYGKTLPNEKIFFICPSFIMNGHNDLNQKCMSIDDIKEIMDMNITIGAHSFYHTKLEVLPDLKHQVYHIKHDTKNMVEWFGDELNLAPIDFCFPYNNDLKGLYQGLVKPYGFINFYGSSRVDIPA